MEKAGNQRFWEFLKEYGIQRMSIHKKYYTKAAKYYRQYLDELVRRGQTNILKGKKTNGNIEEDDMEEYEKKNKPDKEEGVKLEGMKNNLLDIKPMGFGSDDMFPKKKKKRSRSRFKEGWEKGKRKMEKWGNSISKKFGKIFRRSKSKKKAREEDIPDDDISASNDSYFEIKKIKKSKKPQNQNRFDDDLISFKKNQTNVPNKPFNGWKNYLEKPSKSKLSSEYKKKVRAFKSQNSSNMENLKVKTPERAFPVSQSDSEKIRRERVETEGCSLKEIGMEGTYQDPFFKKNDESMAKME